MNINELRAGDTASLMRIVTDDDVRCFAEITGDYNPIHMDEAWAAETPLQGRIVHGMLLAGYVSSVIANKLPGPGTVYLGQELRFMHPARIGDEITATVRVRKVLPEQNTVVLAVSCVNQSGQRLATGAATVQPPRDGA